MLFCGLLNLHKHSILDGRVKKINLLKRQYRFKEIQNGNSLLWIILIGL